MRNFYGRRMGRRLSTAKQDLLQHTLSLIALDPNWVNTSTDIHCANIFLQPRPSTLLEVGFGQGEHLLDFINSHPQWNVVGAEPFINGTAAVLSQLEPQHLNNVRLWSDDINLLLPKFAAQQFDQISVLFPDPWPKLRHHKRRIIQTAFIEQCVRVLKPQGKFIVATDHHDYLQWMIPILKAQSHLAPQFNWNNLPQHKPYSWPTTTFEAKAIAQGRMCHYLSFHKI